MQLVHLLATQQQSLLGYDSDAKAAREAHVAELQKQVLREEEIKLLLPKVRREEERENLRRELAELEESFPKKAAGPEAEGVPQMGWVLIDFPTSLPQAKLLEEAFSGYKPQSDWVVNEREERLKSASLITAPCSAEANVSLCWLTP